MSNQPHAFENTGLDILNLPALEHITFLHTDKRRAWIETFYSVFALTLITLVLTILIPIIGVYDNIAPFIPLYASGLCLLCGFVYLHHIEARGRVYALRTHDLLYRSGLLVRVQIAVPLNRIQHVEVKRPLLDRHFNLATLEIYTAGASGIDLSIPGLKDDTALRLQAHFLNRIATENLKEDGLEDNPHDH